MLFCNGTPCNLKRVPPTAGVKPGPLTQQASVCFQLSYATGLHILAEHVS